MRCPSLLFDSVIPFIMTRKRVIPNLLLHAAVLVTATKLFCSCTTSSTVKKIRDGYPNVTSSSHYYHGIEDLNSIWQHTEFAQSVSNRQIRVHSTDPLSDVAQECLSIFTAARQYCEEELNIGWRPIDLYILSVWDVPGSAHWVLKASDLAYPLYASVDDSHEQAFLRDNAFIIPLIIHEIVEVSLIVPIDDSRPIVLPEWTSWAILKKTNYTRWFRDGLANYSALRCEDIIGIEDSGWSSSQPLKALHEIRGNMFLWSNHSGDRFFDKKMTDFYDAAMGFFIWISEEEGEGFIKKVLEDLDGHDAVNGKLLKKSFEKCLAVDSLTSYCETIDLPWLGLEIESSNPRVASMHRLKRHEGVVVSQVPAEGHSSLEVGDVILKIGDDEVSSPLQFERILLSHELDSWVEIFIIDKNGGRRTVQMQVCARPMTAEAQ